MVRLPRDLEKHYLHFKANELQAWLLHYSLPCLSGYLPHTYLEHYAALSEGIHILLSERLLDVDLQRAEYLLDTFYRDFAGLYGEGNCGLNVHNIGKHLVLYVRWWGPLYCWSCFGFEDANAKILKSAFGTGNMTKQILSKQEASLAISSLDVSVVPPGPAKTFISQMATRFSKEWKNPYKCQNGMVAGACHPLLPHEKHLHIIMAACGTEDPGVLKKCLRVQIRGQKFYGKLYPKLQRRACNIILCCDETIIDVEYFILNTDNKYLYGVGRIIKILERPYIFDNVGHHVFCVKRSGDVAVHGADKFVEKLFYVDFGNVQYVSKVPNHYGYGVLK